MDINVLQFYEQVLDTASHEVSDDGFVSRNFGNKAPATIDNRRLVLPTHENLKISGDKVIRFHPIKEIVTSGPSPVLKYLLTAMSLNVGQLASLVSIKLLEMCGSDSEHAGYDPEQSELIGAIAGIKPKVLVRALEVWLKILDKVMVADPAKSFIHFYLRKGPELDGVAYKQGTIVTFPLYEELLKAEETKLVFGVKLNNKQEASAFKQLVEFMFPHVGTPNHYSKGSSSNQAPRLESMLMAVQSLVEPLNEIVIKMGDLLKGEKTIPLEWTPVIGKLDKVKGGALIPVQEGNEGTKDGDFVEKEEDCPFDPDPVSNREPVDAPEPTRRVKRTWDDAIPTREVEQAPRGRSEPRRDPSRGTTLEELAAAKYERDRGRGRDRYDDDRGWGRRSNESARNGNDGFGQRRRFGSVDQGPSRRSSGGRGGRRGGLSF